MSSHKILIVDDEPQIIEIVQTNLEGVGFTVVSAQDGAEGLKKAVEELPNLIILDIVMPRMDGWEVLAAVEADSRVSGTPIIMLTCKSEDADILHGLEEGAVEYITKPFYPEDIIHSVRMMLEIYDNPMREERRQQLIARRQRLMGKDPANAISGQANYN